MKSRKTETYITPDVANEAKTNEFEKSIRFRRFDGPTQGVLCFQQKLAHFEQIDDEHVPLSTQNAIHGTSPSRTTDR